MLGYINGYDFKEMEPMRYWAPPASWTEEKKKQTVKDRIFSGNWIAAEKKDGFFMKFIKDEDGTQMLLSRSRNVHGEFPNKIDWVPQFKPFFNALPNGTCLLGEVYFPNNPGSNQVTTILGCLKEKALARQDKGEKLHFYIFDILALNNESYLKKDAEYRFESLKHFNLRYKDYNQYISCATYKEGELLWDYLQSILASDGEGIVLWNKKGLYEPGKRPSKTTMKVKKELKESIDCFFTGRAAAPTKYYTGKEIETWPYWINDVTNELLPVGDHYFEKQIDHKPYSPVTKPYYNGWAGSLEIGMVETSPNSKCRITPDSEWIDGLIIVSIGYISGLTDEVKANYKKYAGKVIEVGAMQLTEDNALRHGKMLGWRPDKTWQECNISQLKDV